jgi:hypothetical protein
MELSAPIHVLKRKAKLLARASGKPLNQALDEIARREGFRSWSLLAQRCAKSAPREKTAPQPEARSGARQITALPLEPPDRAAFIQAANAAFEMVMERMEPDNPVATRKLWDAGRYVDYELLRPDMLPIDRDYALSLIDAFLVHHVLDLALEADSAAKARNT